ncbi:MAG: carbohydrate kinase [Thermaceae bacterium]|nr:carbohydrate kinase [Thermaceae bacterium]
MMIIAGEALIDLNPLQLEGQTAYLPHPGGSPYNVAMGAGRLGVPVEFLGRFSTDGFGQLLQEHIRRSRVGLRYARQGPELTTLALVTPTEGGEFFSFYCENTADRLLQPEDLPATLPQGAGLHFGSISLLLEPTASTLEGLMRREARQRFLSLDPNVRPFLIGDKDQYLQRLTGWLEQVDLVKVSQADLEWLYPGKPLEEVAQAWQHQGPALVLVTQGGQGAFAVTEGGILRVAAPKVSVVDTVGAGDSFMSGTLAWLWRAQALSRQALVALTPEQITALLEFAAKVAAITCTRAGADPPWQEEVI